MPAFEISDMDESLIQLPHNELNKIVKWYINFALLLKKKIVNKYNQYGSHTLIALQALIHSYNQTHLRLHVSLTSHWLTCVSKSLNFPDIYSKLAIKKLTGHYSSS
jgi:hypothetical protein